MTDVAVTVPIRVPTVGLETTLTVLALVFPTLAVMVSPTVTALVIALLFQLNHFVKMIKD